MTPLPSLMVAPNGARKTKADHPAIPITLSEIVETAKACFEAGADGLHLHLRDDAGGHILDAGLYREALRELHRAVPHMMVQITTEAVGRYTPAQQCALVRAVRPVAVSMSLAEMLSGYDIASAATFYADCARADIAVQHILYGENDLRAMSELLRSDQMTQTEVQALFVMGRYTAGQESTPADLLPFMTWLSGAGASVDWAVCAFGRQETQCLAAAAHQGGKLRVGFENSFWNADGSRAETNAERVAEIRGIMRGMRDPGG